MPNATKPMQYVVLAMLLMILGLAAIFSGLLPLQLVGALMLFCTLLSPLAIALRSTAAKRQESVQGNPSRFESESARGSTVRLAKGGSFSMGQFGADIATVPLRAGTQHRKTTRRSDRDRDERVS